MGSCCGFLGIKHEIKKNEEDRKISQNSSKNKYEIESVSSHHIENYEEFNLPKDAKITTKFNKVEENIQVKINNNIKLDILSTKKEDSKELSKFLEIEENYKKKDKNTELKLISKKTDINNEKDIVENNENNENDNKKENIQKSDTLNLKTSNVSKLENFSIIGRNSEILILEKSNELFSPKNFDTNTIGHKPNYKKGIIKDSDCSSLRKKKKKVKFKDLRKKSKFKKSSLAKK